jgi:hypothetical protein
VDDISPYLAPEEAEAFKKRLLAATNKGVFTPISFCDTVHIPTSNGRTLFGGTAAEPGTGAVYIIAHDNRGILRLVRPGENAGRRGGSGPGVLPGLLVYQNNCQPCHGAERLGTENCEHRQEPHAGDATYHRRRPRKPHRRSTARLVAGSGSVWNRPKAAGGRGRGAAPPYPEGVTQYDRPSTSTTR